MRLSGLFLIIFCIVFSCKKPVILPSEPMPLLPKPDSSAISITIKINNNANGIPIILGTTTYTTAVNDTFSVRLLKYYISNISLTNQSGEVYSVPESYFLINQSDSNSCIVTLKNIPANDYTSMSLLIGVDAPRNTAGAQTGALDPLNEMFWGWNTGYIMAKLEGNSPQSAEQSKIISYHIGGFKGKTSAIRTVNLNFPKIAQVNNAHGSIILLSADIAKWFSGVNTIQLSTSYLISNINTDSKDMADNYANMFTVSDVIN